VSGGRPVQRVRQRHVDWLLDRLTGRDWQILEFLRRTRVLTGSQLERLVFVDLAGRSRSVVRWRVLKRLVDWRVLVMLPRRVGGRGSSGAAYVLDTAGVALLRLHERVPDEVRPRRPSAPGERFLRHALGVSELYARLVEAARIEGFTLDDFQAEPAAWLPDGLGGWLKPDAFLSVSEANVADDWWTEIDLATEHLPTVRRKIETYLDFFQRGQLGPNGTMPRVLFVVPDDQRQQVVQALLERLPTPANTLVHVVTASEAVPYVVRVLRE
jgi:hypothetical protein